MKFRAIEKNKGMFLTIMYDVNFGKHRLRGKTNLSVNRDCIKKFNPLELKTTSNFNQTQKLQVLKKLNEFELFVETSKSRIKSENLNDTRQPLKEGIEIYFGRTKEQEQEKTLSLFEFIDYYTNLKANSTYEKNGLVLKYSKNLIYEYKRFKMLLEEYRDYKNISFNYRNINAEFEIAFTNWLREKQYKPNTIGKFFKNIKFFMSKAHIDGHHENLKFKNFTILKEKVDNEYLNDQELEDLFKNRENVPLRHRPKLDYFLLMAYTSLRVSDMLKLSKDNIIFDEIPLIEFMESKNSKPIYFRVNNKVQKILDIYNGVFPNDVLKQKVLHHNLINDLLRKVVKHKKITCHSARRSYVNNEIIRGTPYEDIVRQTGHSTKASFDHYVSQSSDKELLKARARREF